ncbi:SA1362 family protein [Gottfriedia solisilvae]|uniref:Membrane protein n=1 Tax=Gottfriedia solisilvae TaxID=1516104 RepID=A0A8J3AF82_9BACI|nr:SA1362 family protein [Gottfriedia solisilvae]GGI11290.1 membrane protein [Gottfriedia solisilvae]
MNQKVYTSIFYGMIALALFGLIAELINNPAKLLQRILFIGLILLVLYFIYRVFTSSNSQRSQQDSYRKAAKQTVKKYNTQKTSSVKKSFNKSKPTSRKSTSSPLLRKRNKDSSHLTVIEGEKGKKKDRASY